VVVALLILSCSLLGQALEDALNPRLRVAHVSARGFRLRPLVGRNADAL
jgi:peptide/nickel transport system permease protein